MSVRHRITSDSALYLAGELIEAAANAPSADYAAYGPFEDTLVLVDATGTAIAPLPGYVATLRPGEGRFGGCVAVEEGTTNLASTMVIEPHGCSMEDAGFYGNVPVKRLTVTTPDTMNNFGFRSYTDVNLNQSGPNYVTISFWANVIINPGTLSGYVRVHYTDGTEGTHYWTYSPSNWWNISGWQRVTGYATLNPSKTPQYITTWYVFRNNASQGQVDIAGIQIEQKPFATSFVDGTRPHGRLYVPESVWNPAQGTFACWAKSNDIGGDYRHLTLQWGRDVVSAASRFGLFMMADGKMRFSFGTDIADAIVSPISTDDGEWHHYAATWVNGTKEIHLYVDGVKVASESVARTISNLGGRWNGVIPIGHRGFSYNNQWWNGLIDELLILPYAASEEEVHSLYQTTVARFHANGDVSIKGELVEGDTGFRYGSDGNLYVNELVEGVNF